MHFTTQTVIFKQPELENENKQYMILRDRYPRRNRINSKLNMIKSHNSNMGFQCGTWERQKRCYFLLFIHIKVQKSSTFLHCPHRTSPKLCPALGIFPEKTLLYWKNEANNNKKIPKATGGFGGDKKSHRQMQFFLLGASTSVWDQDGRRGTQMTPGLIL